MLEFMRFDFGLPHKVGKEVDPVEPFLLVGYARIVVGQGSNRGLDLLGR